MIKSEDISVIVQGGIDKKETKKCLKSIRKYLPKAEIILSTWKNSDITELDYDVLVESDDPGAVMHDIEFRIYNNINRQLVSTKNGLKRVSRKYTLKLRTDFFLCGNRFLKFFDKFPIRDEKYSCFKHRVIVSSMFSREYTKYKYKMLRIPFHPSDFYLFGLSEDIKSYFEKTDLMPVKDMANYNFLYKKRQIIWKSTFRYTPEQYLCLNFAKQFFPDIKFDDWTDWNFDNASLSKKFLYNNFIFLSFPEAQINSNKHKKTLYYENFWEHGIITYKRFVRIYRKMFDKKYSANEFLMSGYWYDKMKIKLLKNCFNQKNFFVSVCRIFYYQFC